MSTEPPPPVWIPPIVQHTGRGVCWSTVVAEIEADNAERAKKTKDPRQVHDAAEPEAA